MFKLGSKASAKSKSAWFIGATVANLDIHNRNSLPAFYLATAIPPNSGKRLQPTLEILVDELMYCYHVGSTVYDASSDTEVLLRAKLAFVVADLRALHKVETVLQSPSPDGCISCPDAGYSVKTLSEKQVNKTIYPRAFRDLPETSKPLRRAAAPINRFADTAATGTCLVVLFILALTPFSEK